MNHLAPFAFLVVCCVQLTMTQVEKNTISKLQLLDERILDRKLRRRPKNYVYPITPCCDPGFTYVDLSNDAPCDGTNTASGIEVIQSPTVQPTTNEDCSKMALLKVHFDRLTQQPSDMCVRRPYCGRRMLRIDLALSSGTRSGFGFDIGDSRTNNAYAGDAGTQENDAETDGIFPNVKVWGSDSCGSVELGTFANVTDSSVNRVTIYVSNRHVRILNDQGFDRYICNKKCLYALNGQSDNEGLINEDVYIALNQVIQNSASRRGTGVCSATLRWVCRYW